MLVVVNFEAFSVLLSDSGIGFASGEKKTLVHID
jgi:hypothetical protein